MKAVVAYQKKLNRSTTVAAPVKLDQEMEKQRKIIVRSFSLAKNLYTHGHGFPSARESELKPGADFLESNTALSQQQETRLKQMGATVRNGGSYIGRMKLNKEREHVARTVIGKMSVEQLSDLLSFYRMMDQICSEVLERKLQDFSDSAL